MTGNTQGRSGWDVAFGNAPRKGSRAMPVLLDFTIESPVGVNLTFDQESEKLEFVQAIFVDNSTNAQQLTATFNATGQAIIIPAGWQAYLPVLAGLSNCKVAFSVPSGTPKIPCFFLNFPVPMALWPASITNGTQLVTSAANTTGGVSTFAASGGTGNALLTATAVAVKASAGNLYGINLFNGGGVDAYVQLFDALAANVTLGTTVPKLALWVPANGAWEEKYCCEGKISFATGITIAATTTSTGAVAPGTGILANIMYK